MIKFSPTNKTLGVLRNLNKTPRNFQRVIRRTMSAEMIAIQREAMLNLSDDVLHVRTGRLRNSVEVKVESRSRKTRGVVMAGGSGVEYARIHEEGGTITPQTAQALTVPLDAAKTAAGVVRGGARSFPDTFLLKRKGKKPLIMQRKGKDIIPLFVLMKKVTIPARPFLRPAVDKRIPFIRRNLKADLKESFKK